MTLDLSTVSAIVTPLLSAGLAWVVARRKNQADVEKTEAETDLLHIKNVEAIVLFWKNMAADLTNEIHQLKQKMIDFTRENRELKDQIQSARQESQRERVEFIKQIESLKQNLQK